MIRRTQGRTGYQIPGLARPAGPRYAANEMPSNRTWKLTLSYDGTDFAGWQVQPGQPTVQEFLEDALARIEGAPVQAAGSGRTDAGVHALAQVASCSMRSPIPGSGLLKALNRLLPPAIRVTSASVVPPRFHARRAAIAKTYEYRIQRSPICPPFESRYVYWHPYALDEESMFTVARLFEGERDFRSFASAGRSLMGSTVRTVFSSELCRTGDRLVYRVRGSGFLYRMVRNMVGTLLDVGRGNVRGTDVEAILEARDRRAAGPTAPARGLFLASVEYAASWGRLAGPPASSSSRQ